MKRIIPCLLLLPLLCSCVVQEGYYEPGYYPPPPPPRVEVHRYGHHPQGYRPAPRAHVERRGYANNNVHGHGNNHGGRPVVTGNARQPQAHGQSGPRGHDDRQDTQQSGNVVIEHH